MSYDMATYLRLLRHLGNKDIALNAALETMITVQNDGFARLYHVKHSSDIGFYLGSTWRVIEQISSGETGVMDAVTTFQLAYHAIRDGKHLKEKFEELDGRFKKVAVGIMFSLGIFYAEEVVPQSLSIDQWINMEEEHERWQQELDSGKTEDVHVRTINLNEPIISLIDFEESDLINVFEIARTALINASSYNLVADAMDLADPELESLRNRIVTALGEVGR